MALFSLTILIGLYGAVGLFAAYMTFQEQKSHENRAVLPKIGSYLLCLVWPVLLVGMLVFARFRPAEFAPADLD